MTIRCQSIGCRSKLEAEVKRIIAEMKIEAFKRLPQMGSDSMCTELERLRDVACQLRSVFQVEHTRRQKAEGSLEEMLNEVALMDKNR